MHPDLEKIASELDSSDSGQALALRFGLACVEEVAGNLESDEAIAVLERFRACLASFGPESPAELQALSASITKLAASHPGSSSLDGSRHAAVSATYALAKAVNGQSIEAAAYAAYSSVYGYGGYAVSDPDAFSEVHRRQLDRLRALKQQDPPFGS
ncbi:hypothetical protein [Azohydromonas lata]|uniref:Uncharacterized protein n=1 Tax=Azohydromonas lata TaxID=45677 RepID=A0ABU5IHX0_9BURK|nr:hypothetical protein [Azohydromonas lata]MDZ5458090.1 hypothetical protein [Azohydromonas lata]